MIRLVSGKLINVVEHPDGSIDNKTLREVVGAGPDRVLTVERADGGVDLIPSEGQVRLAPDDAILDRLNATRGRS